MDARQEQLLKLVIENHIETAEPIGSKFLVSESKLDWSEATVRNELRALEEEGYLTHPHTSAGRIPTEKGYKFFVNCLDFTNIKTRKKENTALEDAIKISEDFETAGKNLAKTVAELADATVVLAFSPNKVYYTGLSNLFHQPEFKELSVVVDISSMFDRCEECLDKFFDQSEDGIKFFFGNEHPFGHLLSVATFKFGENSLFTLMGPMRMNYKRNFEILDKVKTLVNK